MPWPAASPVRGKRPRLTARCWRSWPPGAPCCRMRPTWPPASAHIRPQVVHGDYHVDNVIVDGEGKLSGVIDLEPILGYPVWEVYYAIWWSLRAWDIGAFETPLARAFVCGYLEEARLTPEELRAGPELLYWWLLLATWDARRYAKDPADLDALNGVLWFYRLARWLGRHGGQLGTELASLARSQ